MAPNSTSRTEQAMDYEITRTDAQWRELLNPSRYAILRQAATERAFTGALLDENRRGIYACGGCGAQLFTNETKFDSHCGWPSFYDSIDPSAVELVEDRAHGMVRTEVRCARCGSHLGHVFDDAPQTPTGDRFCMNSLSLTFEPVASDEADEADSSTGDHA